MFGHYRRLPYGRQNANCQFKGRNEYLTLAVLRELQLIVTLCALILPHLSDEDLVSDFPTWRVIVVRLSGAFRLHQQGSVPFTMLFSLWQAAARVHGDGGRRSWLPIRRKRRLLTLLQLVGSSNPTAYV